MSSTSSIDSRTGHCQAPFPSFQCLKLFYIYIQLTRRISQACVPLPRKTPTKQTPRSSASEARTFDLWHRAVLSNPKALLRRAVPQWPWCCARFAANDRVQRCERSTERLGRKRCLPRGFHSVLPCGMLDGKGGSMLEPCYMMLHVIDVSHIAFGVLWLGLSCMIAHMGSWLT